jgi:U32 family peptidase
MIPTPSWPELLVPAGNPAKFEVALRYGADAIYLGGSSLNLRSSASGFDPATLDLALSRAHANNVRVYYCLNAFARESDLSALRRTLAMLAQLPIDGLIVADPGVFALARKYVPHVGLHVSTQANTGNSAAVEFWRAAGAVRVNLGRELSLHEIRQVAGSAPEMELEVFVHGAMCLALSGRCSLSAHLNRRSANRGQCTQPCRFEYRAVAMAVEERLRPGEVLWETLEQEGYTAFFSPRDLCLVKYLPWFCKNRIHALKIEGRMRSRTYVALVCDVYRTALDDLRRGAFRPEVYLRELGLALHRPMDSGFFLPGPRERTVRQWECTGARTMVAHIEQRTGQDAWRVLVLDQWDAARAAELMLPGLVRPELPSDEYALESEQGGMLTRDHQRVHPGQRVILRCDQPVEAPGDLQGCFVRQSQPRRLASPR